VCFRELIYALHRRDCTYLEDVSAAMELHRSEADDLGRLDYQSTRDEIKTKVRALEGSSSA
jgi:hypothetical protein